MSMNQRRLLRDKRRTTANVTIFSNLVFNQPHNGPYNENNRCYNNNGNYSNGNYGQNGQVWNALTNGNNFNNNHMMYSNSPRNNGQFR